MNRLKVTFLLVIFSFLLIFTLLTGETMIIQKLNETLTFDTAEIQEITFAVNSVQEYENIFSKIPIKLMQNYPNPFNIVNRNLCFSLSLKAKLY